MSVLWNHVQILCVLPCYVRLVKLCYVPCVVFWYSMLRRATVRCAVLSYAGVLCSAVSRFALLCCTMLSHDML